MAGGSRSFDGLADGEPVGERDRLLRDDLLDQHEPRRA